jgi:hypothetical protein
MDFGNHLVSLLGDYNGNGTVDSADYVIWRKTLGTNVTPFTGADGSGDGTVGPEDYDVWTAHFGESLPPGAGSGGSTAGGETVAIQEPIAGVAAMGSIDVGAGRAADSSPIAGIGLGIEASVGGGKADVAVTSVVMNSQPARPSEANGARSQRLAAVLTDAGKRDAALVDWVESRLSGAEMREAESDEYFAHDESSKDSRERVLDAVDQVFENLSAWAA